MNRVDELLLSWQDGSITEAELAELKQLLASPEHRARAAQEFFLTGVVMEAVRTQSAARQRATDAEEQPAQPAATLPLAGSRLFLVRRPLLWLSGLAAAALIALLSTFWFQPRPPAEPDAPLVFAHFEQVQGETFVLNKQQRTPAQAGQVLVAGQGIATEGAESEAVVQMEDSVRLKLGGDTMVFTSTEADAPDGPKVLLEQGELLVEVTRSLGRKKMTVQTPVGTAVAESENTALHVSEAAGVAVVRGEVHFVHAASGRSIRLRGGQYVVAAPEGELYAAQLFSGEGNVWTRFHYSSFTDVPGVTFSPDGRQLAAVTRSAEDGLRLGPVGGEPLPLDLAGDSCLAFSPDGRLVATADQNNVILYDAADGRQVQVLLHPQRNPRVVRLAFAPDGKTIAVGRGGWRDPGIVELWDLATGAQRVAWRSHAQGINALAFSPDGKLLASASTDMTVALWNMETMQQESKILNVSGLVPLALAFSPDGKTLSVGTGPRDFRLRRPGEIQLWEVETRMLRASLRGHGRAVTSLAYSADGRTLVSGSADTTVRFWDLPAGREYGMLKGHQAAVGFEGVAVALSADGRWLATASMDRTVKLWKLAGTKGPVAPTAARILPDPRQPSHLARWLNQRHRAPDA